MGRRTFFFWVTVLKREEIRSLIRGGSKVTEHGLAGVDR